jgi:hypothetical protein
VPAILVSSIPTPPPPQRPKDHHNKDDTDDPVEGPKEAGHCRLQMRDSDQCPLDDDREGYET